MKRKLRGNSKITEKEFRVMIVKMIKSLENGENAGIN